MRKYKYDRPLFPGEPDWLKLQKIMRHAHGFISQVAETRDVVRCKLGLGIAEDILFPTNGIEIDDNVRRILQQVGELAATFVGDDFVSVEHQQQAHAILDATGAKSKASMH